MGRMRCGRGMRWGLALMVIGLGATRMIRERAEKPRSDEAQRPVIRVIEEGPIRAKLDLSSSVLRVDLPEDLAFGDGDKALETPIAARLSPWGGFISASVLAAKAKAFDDGLYAAVELAAEDGVGRLGAKRGWIAALARGLSAKVAEASSGNAGPVVWSAARLGEIGIELSKEESATVDVFLKEFLSDQTRSKPISFYTWSDPLARIFRQDRMLQTPLDSLDAARAAAAALDSDKEAKAAYDAYLTLEGRLSNPLVGTDLRSVSGGESARDNVAILPASRAYETHLVMELYGDRPIPDGFNLADEMFARIRSGTLSIAPGADSGWYDYQTFALEPLVVPEKMPEAKRLSLTESYKRQLVELFKGILALTRETHEKQLLLPVASTSMLPDVTIAPELSAEPLPTHYLRRAESYRFIHEVLRESFGADELQTLHRQTASGPVSENLDTEPTRMRGLCFGAYAAVSRQIGIEPTADPATGSGQGVDADAQAFRAWAAQAGDDPDVGGDHRMMVPVFYDLERRKTKAWVFLGWSSRPLTCEYETRPGLEIFHKGRPVDADRMSVNWDSSYFRVDYPVTAEVYVDRILNREEFRALCDQYRTRAKILERLQ